MQTQPLNNPRYEHLQLSGLQHDMEVFNRELHLKSERLQKEITTPSFHKGECDE